MTAAAVYVRTNMQKKRVNYLVSKMSTLRNASSLMTWPWVVYVLCQNKRMFCSVRVNVAHNQILDQLILKQKVQRGTTCNSLMTRTWQHKINISPLSIYTVQNWGGFLTCSPMLHYARFCYYRAFSQSFGTYKQFLFPLLMLLWNWQKKTFSRTCAKKPTQLILPYCNTLLYLICMDLVISDIHLWFISSRRLCRCCISVWPILLASWFPAELRESYVPWWASTSAWRSWKYTNTQMNKWTT